MAQLAQASPALLEAIDMIPSCVKLSVIDEIVSSSCKTDIPCLCTDNKFLINLSQAILRGCKPSDQDISLHIAQGICSASHPSLNDSRQREIIAVLVVMTIASTVAVVLRLLARNMSAAKYGMDDLFIVIALALTYGLNANELIALQFGFGKHQLMLSFNHMKKFLLIYYETQIILTCAITTTRLSLLLFYCRVFPIQRFRTITAITGLVIIAWWMGTTLAIMFTCIPVHAFWDRSVEGKCVNEHTQVYAITGTEVATNIAVIILPIPWLWGLHLPTPKKIALGGIFLLGSFVCISCIIRYPFLIAFQQGDSSFTIVPTALWVVVECNLGIVSVCLPIMRPLFVNKVPYPVRSRFSAFPFSMSKPGTKGVSRAAVDKPDANQDWSGNTLTSIRLKSLPRTHSLRFGNENNITLASQGAEQGHDDETSSRHENEPWKHNVGAPSTHQHWQLDVIPTWTSLESGIRADGRLDKWEV